jgi:hypothetical protein
MRAGGLSKNKNKKYAVLKTHTNSGFANTYRK